MTRSVVADGQHLAPLDALSGISISTTETIPASCANATDFFNTLLGVVDGAGNPVRRGNDTRCSVPGLFFAGMTPGLVSYFHNADKEGREIARVISAR